MLVAALIISNTHHSNLELSVLFFLLGFFSGSQVLAYALVVEVNPPHVVVTAESQTSTLIMSAGAIFQPLFALVVEHYSTGTSPALAYQDAMWLLPLTLSLGLILSCFMKETRCNRIA